MRVKAVNSWISARERSRKVVARVPGVRLVLEIVQGTIRFVVIKEPFPEAILTFLKFSVIVLEETLLDLSEVFSIVRTALIEEMVHVVQHP